MTSLFEKSMRKLEKKYRKRAIIALKKSQEILIDPHRYKNLKAPQQHLKRVHIDNSFVLLFSIDEEKKTVVLEEFKHHDKAYKEQ